MEKRDLGLFKIKILIMSIRKDAVRMEIGPDSKFNFTLKHKNKAEIFYFRNYFFFKAFSTSSCLH